MGGGRDDQDFPLENFCLTVPKNFAKEPLVFQFFRLLKTVGYKRGWGKSRKSNEIVLSYSTKTCR